jgi:hypothetical protein
MELGHLEPWVLEMGLGIWKFGGLDGTALAVRGMMRDGE